MAATGTKKPKVALVVGTLPAIEEIDQFRLLEATYDITVVTSQSIGGYLTQNCFFQDLKVYTCADNEDNPTYLPGIEKALKGAEIVIVKERLGMYAFQVVKAKWRQRFRMILWVDNAAPFPGEDVSQLRTIRTEVTASADAFLVQSNAAKSALLIEGIPENKIHSFRPFVEKRVDRSKANRANALKQLNLVDSNIVIAYFGQIEYEENLLELLHAVSLLPKGSVKERIRVVVCGIGSFSNEIRARAAALKIDQQCIYVAPSRLAYTAIVAAADALYWSPIACRDRLEAEPFRPMAAMVHGIPVLSARTPVGEELFGKHRLDFCSGAPESLAEAIAKITGTKAVTASVVKKNLDIVAKHYSRQALTKQLAGIFQQVLAVQPSVAINAIDNQVIEAEELVANKRYVEAIDAIEALFKQKDLPLHHRANLYRLIGDSFVKLGENDAGKSAYQQSIELDQTNAKSYIGLGTISLTKSNHDSAILSFQKAVALAPEDDMANLGLGMAFQGLGEQNEANRWAVRALNLNPTNLVAVFTLVQIAHARNQFAEVEAALARYLKALPDDTNIQYTYAAILMKVGKLEDSLRVAEAIVAKDAGDERATALIRQIRASKDHQTKAGGANKI
jgi:glycosyltransferase involved in cell wall biosynthesis/cytochrome c-type biogenesis protein CcmH/NrfG